MNTAQQNYSAIMQRYPGISFMSHARIDDHQIPATVVEAQAQKTPQAALESFYINPMVRGILDRSMLG
jgi:hypothetical protein